MGKTFKKGACDCHIDIRYSTLGHWRHIRDTFAANSGRKSSGEMAVFVLSCGDLLLEMVVGGFKLQVPNKFSENLL